MAKFFCPLCGNQCHARQKLWPEKPDLIWHWDCAEAAGVKQRPVASERREAEPPASAEGHLGLGDTVEKIAKPIAKALRLSCLDPAGALRPDSKCAQRRNKLNALGRKFARRGHDGQGA
ncbi:hypothetical protein [Cerasicoccus maritimus]|uniref:hypothetical protein n=1 Tax=Cerasicoccus maritimus TaxID=490089 RepID=UPI0028527FF7|nr:hypothetical protein [Cerasicoccus maritimus]